ncbi:FAD-binding protein, partial [Sutterella sp.]|uniref:FAD-binding protein n=1 Tax=Sutterella sp. TaxID=1981025 RepID=UPI0026DEBF99
IINEAKTYVEMAKELPVITRDNWAYIVIDSSVLENDTVATRLDRYRAKKAPIFQGNTFAELARAIGMDEKVLTKTLEDYNKAVESGKAGDMNPPNTLKAPRLLSKAPFLALPFQGGMTATFGGPKINAKGQVLNAEQQPIPGLYAAGNAIGGLFYYNYIVGSQLTAAVIFGRHAAQDMAARAKKAKA